MKKILLAVMALSPLAFADVLLDDFEDDDRTSLLSEQDFWFNFTDSADVGCTTYYDADLADNVQKEYPSPCSRINTINYDFNVFSEWSYEPIETTYENEDGESVDTTLYFPLRAESPFTAEDRQEEGPAVQHLEANETIVAGLRYELGEAQLMMTPTPDGYNLAEPNYWFVPYVAMGLKTVGNGSDYDLSKCKGISYKYRGQAHMFRADLSTVKDNNYHAVTVDYSEATSNEGYHGTTKTIQGYSTATILWSQLKQEDWGIKRNFDASKIEQLVWVLKGGNGEKVSRTASTTTTNLFDKLVPAISSEQGFLVIDDVTCITTVASDTEIPVGPRSSSSVKSSSSAKSSSSEKKSTSEKSSSSKKSSSKKSSSSSKKGKDAIHMVGLIEGFSIYAQHDGLSIKTQSPVSVLFFDQNGRLIQPSVELNVGDGFIPFDNMAKGMYFAVVKKGSESLSMKFTVR